MPASEEWNLCGAIIQHNTKGICKMNSRKQSRPQSSHGTPQENANMGHDIQDDNEDPACKFFFPRQPRCNPTGCLLEEGNVPSALVIAVKQFQKERGSPGVEETDVFSTTTVLPELFSVPRNDRKRGRKDEAAGPSYAVYDSTTKEVAGDTRAEMPYLASDKEFAGLFHGLWDRIDTLSRDYFGYVIPDTGQQRWLQSIPGRLHPKRSQDKEFVDLVAEIAVGGPCGVGSWEQIFLEPELRRGLVCGIVWRKLRLEVFDKMLFGGTKLQEKELLELEESMLDIDGFARTRARGLKIREMLDCPNPADNYTIASKGSLPHHPDEARRSVTIQLREILSCLMPPSNSTQVLTALEEITHKAAHLSRLLRLDTETIYYFPFIEKDSCFHPNDVEENVTYFCKEHKEWLSSPQNRADKTVAEPAYGLTEDKVKRIHSYDPLIRIICSGAVETYRKGGWRPEDTQKGYRKRILFPARVILRWGVPQEKSSLKSGYQEPVSRCSDSPASYMGFREAVGFLGAFRDKTAISTFAEMKGLPWYLQDGVRDPAWSVEGYPVLGGRGTGNQPFVLEMFRPNRTLLF